ncbi:MAG TPA: hypothetical protein VJ550_12590 [Geomonas sp.]|nr:hypothetical protein [Geomonas sp.]
MPSSTAASASSAPDFRCRTASFTTDFSNCLTEDGKCRCNFAILFVDGYLCTHPNHRDFS